MKNWKRRYSESCFSPKRRSKDSGKRKRAVHTGAKLDILYEDGAGHADQQAGRDALAEGGKGDISMVEHLISIFWIPAK